MQIEFPKYDVVKINTEQRFHAHVINQTGTKTNLTTSCIFHLYNITGYDINNNYTQMEFEGYNGIDFAITIKGDNFSRLGLYNYVIQCNSSNQIAFATSPLEVTTTGEIPTTAQSIMYSGSLFITIFIFLLCVFAGIALPSGNNRDEMTGYILSVNNLKYVKIFSWALAYISLILVFYLSEAIVYNYLNIPAMASILHFGYIALIVCVLPLFIVGVYILIANAVRDHNVADALKGGLRVRDG